MRNLIVPPGGFAGFSQMTPASRQRLSQGTRRVNGNGKRRRRKAAKAARRTTRRAKGSRKLKFGSPAWRKKYMRK